MSEPKANSLVLYKSSPARVIDVADKYEIILPNGETLRVRAKDIQLLHPGPITDLKLGTLTGEITEAWEMLAGQKTTLSELSELAFGTYSPESAWAAWQSVAEGVYFEGTPQGLSARSREQVAETVATREKARHEIEAWKAFLERARSKQILPEDKRFLNDAEALALGRSPKSKLLRELGMNETPENAHSFLLRTGYWNETINPYPSRAQLPWSPPRLELAAPPEEERRDLTHLPAFAIDDEDTQDPDDAISLEGDTFWIHVADVAAIIVPDSPADLEARGMSANLYLPERIVPMLPPLATQLLGLGLAEISPALSVGVALNEKGEIVSTEVVPSRVKVTRISYAQVDKRIDEPIFSEMYSRLMTFKNRRQAKATPQLTLPEVKVRVLNDQVVIKPLPPLKSRELVTEAMLLAGEAAGKFALEHRIPFPYTTQSPPDVQDTPKTLAEMFAYRKKYKRSQMKSIPEPHAGLGLDVYVRATSPLRRYLDLVVHQQLRAHIKGEKGLDPQQVLSRVGAAEAVLGSIRRTERQSNLHWTLVYLQRNPGWKGKAVVVDIRGHSATLIIPDLGLEERVPLDRELSLNSEVEVQALKVDIPHLSAHFRIT